jgi:hypothetical protein
MRTSNHVDFDRNTHVIRALLGRELLHSSFPGGTGPLIWINELVGVKERATELDERLVPRDDGCER